MVILLNALRHDSSSSPGTFVLAVSMDRRKGGGTYRQKLGRPEVLSRARRLCLLSVYVRPGILKSADLLDHDYSSECSSMRSKSK